MPRTARDILRELERAGLLLETTAVPKVPFTSLTYDSREAGEGTLFVCKGRTFRRDYLIDAVARGAAAYLSEVDYGVDRPLFRVRDIRRAMPLVASTFYDRPERALTLVGVTGTKGKTTVLSLLRAILEAAGRFGPRVGFFSSMEVYDGVTDEPAALTTPEALELYRHLDRMRRSGLRAALIEVSSQALRYRRVDGLTFDLGAFLNISEDHISPAEHRDYEDYLSAKLRLFAQSRRALVNRDSVEYERVLRAVGERPLATFSARDPEADYLIRDLTPEVNGLSFRLIAHGVGHDVYLPMTGAFNAENAAAALALADQLGVPLETAAPVLAQTAVKGRMTRFVSADGKRIVLVDYAHNRLSFLRLMQEMKRRYPTRRMTAVFGSVGGKAYNRRRDLGEVAGAFCDAVWLTSDNPAGEDPAEINREIGHYLAAAGCPWESVPDRAEALSRAFAAAGEEPALILLLGRGCERTMTGPHGCEPYPSDLELAQAELKRYDETADR